MPKLHQTQGRACFTGDDWADTEANRAIERVQEAIWGHNLLVSGFNQASLLWSNTYLSSKVPVRKCSASRELQHYPINIYQPWTSQLVMSRCNVVWGSPVVSWFINPHNYSYLRTINHSEIGVMCTNLAIERGPHIVGISVFFWVWDDFSHSDRSTNDQPLLEPGTFERSFGINGNIYVHQQRICHFLQGI